MSSQDDVRAASARFYQALNDMANGDARSMADCWSHDASVTTMHPIGGREIGWDQVRASFEGVAGVASDGRVSLRDQRIEVVGDLAYEIGVEQGEFTVAGERLSIEHRVTNIYRREVGGWKIVHHHTDISPAMVEVLQRLQAA